MHTEPVQTELKQALAGLESPTDSTTYEQLLHIMNTLVTKHAPKSARPPHLDLHQLPEYLTLLKKEENNNGALRLLIQQLRSMRKELTEQHVNELCSTFEDLISSDAFFAYQHLQKVTYKPTVRTEVTAQSPEARKQRIAAKCHEQLSNPLGDPDITFPPKPTTLRYNTAPFTEDELNTALRDTSSHKALSKRRSAAFTSQHPLFKQSCRHITDTKPTYSPKMALQTHSALQRAFSKATHSHHSSSFSSLTASYPRVHSHEATPSKQAHTPHRSTSISSRTPTTLPS
jgi:hypothetical protein